MAEPFIASVRLHIVTGSPEFAHPAYMIYARKVDSKVLDQALQGLRPMARPLTKQVMVKSPLER